MSNSINLVDNSSIKGREEKFTTLEVDLHKIVKDWKTSLFSFEWLLPNGQVRTIEDLTENRAAQFRETESAYKHERPMERPVLGLGMIENVEIGSKKEILLTLYSLGVVKMEVHVPTSCLKDFQKFM